MNTVTMADGRRAATRGRISFWKILGAEWIKLRTVRSTFWTLLSGIVVSIGLSVVYAVFGANDYDSMDAQEKGTFDPTATGLMGLHFGVVAFGVLGVLLISSEYSTGLIRACLAAVPRRSRYLAAKGLTLGVVVLVVGEVVSFVSFFISQMIFDGEGIATDLGEAGVARAVLGAGLYLAGSAVLGLALGVLLRHTAGAITALLGLLYVLPVVGGFLRGEVGEAVNKLLPSNTGAAIMTVTPTDTRLAPWTGFAVFCLYIGTVLVAAAVRLAKSDV